MSLEEATVKKGIQTSNQVTSIVVLFCWIIVLKGLMSSDAGVLSSVSQSSFYNLYMRNDKTCPLEALWDTCDRR
jgi:hypothetical protein